MIAIQVREVSDLDAAMVALGLASADICALDAGWDSAWGLSPGDRNNPKYVSEVMLTGPGPMIFIDGGDVPYRFLRRIPDLVARRLEDAGVENAVVGVPPDPTMPASTAIPRAVVLRLYPPPAPTGDTNLPSGWLKHALDWVRNGLGDDDEMWAMVASVQFPLRVGDSASYFKRSHEARSGTELWSGDTDSRLRLATGAFSFRHQNLALAAGGPGASDEELLESMERLKDVARALAPELGLAFIDFNCSFGEASSSNRGFTRTGVGGPTFIEPICDEQAFDAFPWQIFGPGHLKRLGELPVGARLLAGGRFEVTAGETNDWMWPSDEPGSLRGLPQPIAPARVAARETGRRVLAGVLPSYDVTTDIHHARYRMGKYRILNDQAPK